MLDPQIMESLLSYRAESDLKHEALIILAKMLPNEDTNLQTQTFQQINTDCSGWISDEQLRIAV